MAAYDTWLRKSGFMLAASALALVLIVSAFAMYSGISTALQKQQLVNDTRASILTVVDLRVGVTEAETTMYEYIESNGAGNSQSYQAARSHLSSDVQRLEAPQGIDTGTSQDITQLRRLTPATLAGLQSVALLAQSGQFAAAIQRLSVGDVGQALKSLRSVIERIQMAEIGVLRNQISSAATAARALLWISAATALFALGAFIAVLVVLKRTLALREQFAQERIRADSEAQVKILEATYQRMKIFLEIASHEIRTPLTSLKLAIQLSLRAVQRVIARPQEDIQQYSGASDIPAASLASVVSPLNRALISTELLERLVADLIDSTRIEVSALEMRPTARDLGQIIDDCVEEQRIFHPDRNIVVSKPDHAITVVADGDRIRQVVVNYLNNAHKFTEKRYPITVAVSANDREAMVRVRDEGPGIPAEEQSRIWDQFYRAPGIGHVSGSSEGFGLGLFISASIINRHGGKLGVESAVGQGSTFWFTLPLPVASHAPSPVAHDDWTLKAAERDGSSRKLRYGMA